MVFKLKILDVLIKRLKERKSPFLGKLYGILHENTLIILSFTLNYIEEQEDLKYHVSESNFPTEVDLYGVVNCKQNVQKCEDNLPKDINNILQDVIVTDNPVILSYGYLIKEDNVQSFFYSNGIVTETRYDIITEAEIWQQFLLVNLNIPVNFICHNRVKDKEDYINDFVKKISSGAAMFHIEETEIYLNSNNSQDINSDKDVSYELSHNSTDSLITSYLKTVKAEKPKVPTVLNVSILMKCTGKASETTPKQALAIQQVTKTFEGIRGCLSMDSLIMFQKNKTEKYLYNALVDSVCRIWKLMKQRFTLYDNIPPEICHFYLPYLGHFVTLVYPSTVADDDLSDIRKCVHTLFNLPCEKPLFRRALIYRFFEQKIEKEPLKNVHIGLPNSGINGNVSIVQGEYMYYHYNHNNINDSGWGCAYRSLQTLFSWYKLQGWTHREVPSLTEIQQVLVDIKDKPKTFVGSRQWIGSLEVSFVLDTMLTVTCRVLNVTIGESVANYAHELSNHFQKHGTPVMIGGGVLAHTILGVDINDETDDVKFLVLDPHFTGQDQLPVIQNKGWVGWKNSDFWKKDTFYNMCLPYRKVGV